MFKPIESEESSKLKLDHLFNFRKIQFLSLNISWKRNPTYIHSECGKIFYLHFTDSLILVDKCSMRVLKRFNRVLYNVLDLPIQGKIIAVDNTPSILLIDRRSLKVLRTTSIALPLVHPVIENKTKNDNICNLKLSSDLKYIVVHLLNKIMIFEANSFKMQDMFQISSFQF